MKEKETLYITVSGTYNTGKSTIAHCIKRILKRKGLSVSLSDVDGEIPAKDGYRSRERFNTLSRKIEVEIDVEQLPRSALK